MVNEEIDYKNDKKPISLKKVMDMFGCQSEGTASNKIALVRAALNKPKPKVIKTSEFWIYFFE